MKKHLITIAAALLSLSGCVSYERCVDKFGEQKPDTVKVCIEKLVPVAVTAPADSVSGFIRDSSHSGVIKDSTSSIEISYWRDKFNRLFVKAYIPPRIIHDTIPIRDTVYVPVKIITLKKPTPWYSTAWDWLRTGSFYLLVAIGISAVIFSAIRRKG